MFEIKQILIKIEDGTYKELRDKIREKVANEGLFENDPNKFVNYIIIAIDQEVEEVEFVTKEGKMHGELKLG